MTATETILYDLKFTDMVIRQYVGELSQEEWLTRAVEGTNHLTWQFGHLLKSTAGLAAATMPGKLPELPDGFADRYTTETAGSDRVEDFHTRDELLALYDAQHEALCQAISELTEDQMAQPVPERIGRLGKNVGEIAAFQPLHWMMHAGQWATIRRKLGYPPLF